MLAKKDKKLYNEIRDKLIKGANESKDISTKEKDKVYNTINKVIKKSISGNNIIDEGEAYGNKENNGSNNEFRRIQKESRRESFDSIKAQGNCTKYNEGLRKILSTNLQRELERRGYNSRTDNEFILESNKGTTFKIYENVDANTFHDIFEITRKYTLHGELVDLHNNYDDATCYISDDGLSGFAIEKDGNLVASNTADKAIISHKTFVDIVDKLNNTENKDTQFWWKLG